MGIRRVRPVAGSVLRDDGRVGRVVVPVLVHGPPARGLVGQEDGVLRDGVHAVRRGGAPDEEVALVAQRQV